MKQVNATPRVLNLLAFAAIFSIALAWTSQTAKAADYDLIIMGDLGGFPPDTVNAADTAQYINCIQGAIVCPVGMDMGGFPLNTVTAADFSLFLIRVSGGLPWSLPPTGSFVDFAALGTNPPLGDGTFGVNIASKSSSGYGSSGLHNYLGELQAHVDILSDGTLGAIISTSLVTTAGPNVIATAGQVSNADINTNLTCGPSYGLVTLRYYTRATLIEPSLGLSAANEVCAGNSICAAGEHLDQIDLIAYCRCGDGVQDPEEVCDDGPGETEGYCLDDCSGIQTCGDGDIEGTEVCDDAGANGTGQGFCVADCSAVQICNDTIINGTEECDDGVNDGSVPCGCQPGCVWETLGAVCNPAAGVCEFDDTCDGFGFCLDGGTVTQGVVCRAGSGDLCDPDETCNGLTPFCPSDTVEPVGLQCRSAIDLCDAEETCTGNVGETCPTDDVLSAGTICDGGDGICNPDDTCDGVGIICPVNNATVGTVCFAAAGACDIDDTCDGFGFCLDNGLLTPGTVCRTGSGDFCDPDETCTGAGPACPSDWVEFAGTSCRPPVDLCDADEACTGNVGEACPTDILELAGTVCRIDADSPPPAGGCDAEEVCDGVVITCPADDVEPDDTECFGGDPNFCQNGDCGYCGDGFPGGYEFCDDFPHDPIQYAIESGGSGTPWNVDIEGNYAYVAKQAGGVRVIDISFPGSPSFITTLNPSGNARDVIIESDMAYIATTSGLGIYDVSFPGSPAFTGEDLSLGSCEEVDASENFAYLACGASGLKIVDATDPYTPVSAGSWPTSGSSEGIHVVGSIAYLADGGAGLRILDVSDPYIPSSLGTLGGFSYANDVFVRDNIAYMTDNLGLSVIDVSVPATPVLLGSVVTADVANSVAVWGNIAVVADWDTSRAILFDVSDPTNPMEIGAYNSGGSWVYGVAVENGFAYVAQGTGMRIVDINQESNCISDCSGYQGCWDAITSGTEYCDDGAMNGTGDTYCTSDCSAIQTCGDSVVNGSEFCDDGALNGTGDGHCLSDCSAEQFCGDGTPNGTEFCDESTSNGTGDGFCLGDCSGYQTCGDGTPNGTEVCDDGANNDTGEGWCIWDCTGVQTCGDGMPNGTEACDDFPHTPGTLGLETSGFGAAWGVAVDGMYAYVAKQSGGLRIINVSAPISPFEETWIGTTGDAYDVMVENDMAYVATTSGLEIFDVMFPSSPSPVGSDLTLGSSKGVDVVGDYAYVAAGAGGLEILDVSDPYSPSQVGNYPVIDSANSVEVIGLIAYVADGWSGLKIVDVSDPALPSEIGSFSGISSAYDVVVRDDIAYIADGAGLKIVDVSIPASTSLLGSLATTGTANSVALSGNMALIADWTSAEMVMIDVSDPTDPIEIGSYDSLGPFTYGVAAQDGYAYVAQSNGMRILDISQNNLCVSDCSATQWCGDLTTHGTEVCDDGAGEGEGLCLDDCSALQSCGDGVTHGSEFCDDGAMNGSGDGYCLGDCSGQQSCGDGLVNGAETCDWMSPQMDNCCDDITCSWTPYGDDDPQYMCIGGTECQGDRCDGSGGCTTITEPVGTACIFGAGGSEPTCNPDTCDGAGFCTDNATLPDGTACTENSGTLCCSGSCAAECCGDGAVTGVETCDDGALNGQRDMCDLYCMGTCTYTHYWSQRFGDANAQWISDIAVDGSGNAIVVGSFQGTINLGGANLISQGGYDVFIAKYSVGGALQWSYSYGTTGDQFATAVDVDSSGNIYMGGYHTDTFSLGGASISASAGWDAYLVKYSMGGGEIWTKDFSDNNVTILEDVSVGSSAGEFVTIVGSLSGSTNNFGGFNLPTNGGWDVFAASFSTGGSHQWSNNWGDGNHDYGKGIKVSEMGSGFIYLTGFFYNQIDFSGGGPVTSAGGADIFVAQLQSNGAYLASEIYGDGADQFATEIEGDNNGNVYISGDFQGSITFDSALTATGSSDAFLVSLGEWLSVNWSQRFGGTTGATSSITGLAVDTWGEVAITGSFDNDIDLGGSLLFTAGLADIFVAKFDSTGVYFWSNSFGDASYNETGSAIEFGTAGEILLAATPNGDVDLGNGNLTANGLEDIVLSAFYEPGSPACYVCGDGFQDPGESCDDGANNGLGSGWCMIDCSGIQP